MTVRELFSYRIFTISNFLSLLRILLVPVAWIIIKKSLVDDLFKYLGVGLLFLMVATDFLDGYLARKLGQETPLGQYLDPVADKVAILSLGVMLVIYKDYPVWLIIFLSFREALGIFFGAYLLVKKNILGKPNQWGKWGVGFVAVSGVAYFLELSYKQYSAIPVVIVYLGGILGYWVTYWKTIAPGENPNRITNENVANNRIGKTGKKKTLP